MEMSMGTFCPSLPSSFISFNSSLSLSLSLPYTPYLLIPSLTCLLSPPFLYLLFFSLFCSPALLSHPHPFFHLFFTLTLHSCAQFPFFCSIVSFTFFLSSSLIPPLHSLPTFSFLLILPSSLLPSPLHLILTCQIIKLAWIKISGKCQSHTIFTHGTRWEHYKNSVGMMAALYNVYSRLCAMNWLQTMASGLQNYDK